MRTPTSRRDFIHGVTTLALLCICSSAARARVSPAGQLHEATPHARPPAPQVLRLFPELSPDSGIWGFVPQSVMLSGELDFGNGRRSV